MVDPKQGQEQTIPESSQGPHRAAGRIRRTVKRAAPFMAGVLTILAALVLYQAFFPAPQQITQQDIEAAVAEALSAATPAPAYSAQVYQSIQPSLVLIQTYYNGENGEDNGGLGSGVVISEVGDILTSLHVVAGGGLIQVTFADGTQTAAQIVATQPENDIAVLQPYELPSFVAPAILGNPNAMRVGDEAFAVGNPFGLYSSLSAGVISGFGRAFQPQDSELSLTDLIQIDAAVNPGNSGGPLLNRYGHVVGIVVGIVNPTEDDVFIGIGFAVPIQVAASAAGAPRH